MKVGKVWKTGNSTVITLDSKTLAESKLSVGELVETIVNNKGEVLVRKVSFGERKQ